MTIPARLSRGLYETLGDEAAIEMVDWMNRVGAPRAELRELTELTVSRLEARFGQLEARIDGVEARIGQVEARIGQVEAKLEAGLAGLRRELDHAVADLRRELVTNTARLETTIERRWGDILKWSFLFWLGSLVSLVGVLAALAGFPP
jgi:chromosome segregation ATPase